MLGHGTIGTETTTHVPAPGNLGTTHSRWSLLTKDYFYHLDSTGTKQSVSFGGTKEQSCKEKGYVACVKQEKEKAS